VRVVRADPILERKRIEKGWLPVGYGGLAAQNSNLSERFGAGDVAAWQQFGGALTSFSEVSLVTSATS